MAFPFPLAVEAHKKHPTNIGDVDKGFCLKCSQLSEIYRIFSVRVQGAVASKFVNTYNIEYLNTDLFHPVSGMILQPIYYDSSTFNNYPAMSIMNNISFLYFSICPICQFEFHSQENILLFIENTVWNSLNLNLKIIRKQNSYRRKTNLILYYTNDYKENIRRTSTILEKREVIFEKTGKQNKTVKDYISSYKFR